MAVMAVLLAASVASAAENKDTKKEGQTLAGVKVLCVVVEETSSDLIAAGVSQESLRTAVERRLRNADIQLATDEQFGNTPGMPFLHVVVTALPVKLGPSNALGYAAYVRFSFNQPVRLARTPNLPTSAETWSLGKLVTTETMAELWGAVFDHTNSFTSAYTDANPPKEER
jgi:hypothetical protein